MPICHALSLDHVISSSSSIFNHLLHYPSYSEEPIDFFSFSGCVMESIKGQGGIQLLLTAEQEAQQIVAAARNLKTTRLRQAKEEAEREVALYRKHLEEEYQKSISESSGNSGANVKRLDEETAMKIEKLKGTHSKVSSDVVNMLLKYVTSVRS